MVIPASLFHACARLAELSHASPWHSSLEQRQYGQSVHLSVRDSTQNEHSENQPFLRGFAPHCTLTPLSSMCMPGGQTSPMHVGGWIPPKARGGSKFHLIAS